MLKKNEKGSTLVMVLLIVVVITILGAALFTMNMSASKQFTKKEHQVQARHLAEMGIEHYHAKVEEKVQQHNEKPVQEFYIGTGEDRVLDHATMRRVHTQKLCEEINEIENPLYQNELDHAYNVEVKEDLMRCSNIDEHTDELAVIIESVGKVPDVQKEDGTTSVIEAKVDIMPQGATPPDGNEGEGDENNGSVVEDNDDEKNEEYESISSFPSGSFIKEKNIKFRGNGEIEGGNLNAMFNKSFKIDGSLTIGRLNNDNIKFFVGRDFEGYDSIAVGGGWDSLYEIIIGRDFYQKGSLTLYRQKNHNSQVDNNKFIVCGDAYLESLPNFFNYEDLFLVQGTVYNYDGSQKISNQYKPKSQVFDFGSYCPTSPSQPNPEDPTPSHPDDYKWQVNPDVTPDYFPE